MTIIVGVVEGLDDDIALDGVRVGVVDAEEGFNVGFDVGTYVGVTDSEGLELSLGEFDGLKLRVGIVLSEGPEDGFSPGSLVGLKVGDSDGSADGIGVKHEFSFSATHTCANCKFASMLITLTVTLFPDTVPDHVPPALNFANNSDSAKLVPSPAARVTMTLFPPSWVPELMPLLRL